MQRNDLVRTATALLTQVRHRHAPHHSRKDDEYLAKEGCTDQLPSHLAFLLSQSPPNPTLGTNINTGLSSSPKKESSRSITRSTNRALHPHLVTGPLTPCFPPLKPPIRSVVRSDTTRQIIASLSLTCTLAPHIFFHYPALPPSRVRIYFHRISAASLKSGSLLIGR